MEIKIGDWIEYRDINTGEGSRVCKVMSFKLGQPSVAGYEGLLTNSHSDIFDRYPVYRNEVVRVLTAEEAAIWLLEN